MDLFDIAVASKLAGGGGGGASNVITGTLTTEAASTEAGKVYTIDTGYSGNGYIIAFIIMCTSADLYNMTSNYGYGSMSFYKRATKTAPTYSGTSGENKGLLAPVRKSSSSLTVETSEDTFYKTNGTPSGASVSGVFYINNKSTIKLYVQGTNTNYRGLKPNETYQYFVLYSE